MVFKKMIKLSVLLTPLLGSLSSNAMDSKSAAIATGGAALGAAAVAGAKYFMPGKSPEAKVQEALNVLTLDENFMTLAQAVNKLDEHNQGKIAMAFKLVPQSRLDALTVDVKERAFREGLGAAAVFVQEQHPDVAGAINQNIARLVGDYRAQLDVGIRERQQARAAAQATIHAGAGAAGGQ